MGEREDAERRAVSFGAVRAPTWTVQESGERAFEIARAPEPARTLEAKVVLEGHSHFVQALAFSPDGRHLATGSEDSRIRIWNVGEWTEARVLDDHGSAVNCVAFMRDGRLLSASDDRRVGVWDAATFERAFVLEGHEDYVSKVAPAGASRAVSSGRDGTVRVWDLRTRACLHVMQQRGWVYCLAASSDGRRAVAGSDRNVIEVWDLTEGVSERVLLDASNLYVGDVMGMTLSAPNVSGVGHANAPKKAVFAPDDRTFLTSEGEIIVWDTATGTERARVPGNGWPIEGIAFVPARSPNPTSARDANERALLERLAANPADAAARAVYGDWLEERGELREANAVRRAPGRYVVAGARESIFIVDLDARSIVASARWPHGDPRNVAVSIDGRFAACGSDDGRVGVWDLDALFDAGVPSRHLTTPRSARVSREGIALTATSDRTVLAWANDGASVRLPIDEGTFHEIELTPDGRRALVMTDHGALRVFDLATGALVGVSFLDGALEKRRYSPFSERRFLRDGTMLVGSTSGPLAIWTLDPPRAPELLEGEAGQVVAMDVDEDHDRVITSAFNATDGEPMRIHVWSLSARALVREIALVTEKAQYASALAIVGDRVVAGTSEGGLLVLDLEGALVAAHQIQDSYVLGLVKLASGEVVAMGASLFRVDPQSGEVRGELPLGGKLSARVRGSSQLVLYKGDDVCLLDLAANTLSAPTDVGEVSSVVASDDLGWVVVTTKRAGREGAPILLRRRL